MAQAIVEGDAHRVHMDAVIGRFASGHRVQGQTHVDKHPTNLCPRAFSFREVDLLAP